MLGALLAEAGGGPGIGQAPDPGPHDISGIVMYNEPAFKATKLHAFGRDEVVSITGEVHWRGRQSLQLHVVPGQRRGLHILGLGAAGGKPLPGALL